jgi:protein SCO1/2
MRALRRGKRAYPAGYSVVPVIVRAIPFAILLTLAGCARRFPVEGMVTAVDSAQHTITVSHRAIPGHMPAMVMPFRARPGDIDRVKPGTRIRFQLAGSMARNVRIVGEKGDYTAPATHRKLSHGDLVPDFELIDQQSRRVRLSDFRGRVVAIDFIYTRCPLPDVCPRLSAAFAYVARRFQQQDLTLLSVTVDPGYDTPSVLSDYARRWHADPERWRFLTGTLSAVSQAAGNFGLVFWPEENMIAHTVVTAVVGRQGRLAALIEGASYRPAELSDVIASTLETTR